MQKSNKEILTKEETDFVNRMPIEKVIDLLHYCADERLGLISVGEYNEMTKMPPRTIYDSLETDKLNYIKLCGLRMIIINDK